jgi:hypothetical protein
LFARLALIFHLIDYADVKADTARNPVLTVLSPTTAKRVAAPATPEFRWESQAMSANVNLADKEAVYRALDGR